MTSAGRYASAVFDCDGVILDSNRVKTDAFRLALHDEPPEVIEQFVAHHVANGGVSRYVKFDRLYRSILQVPNPEERTAHALRRFSSAVVSGLLQCAEIPGVGNVLRVLHAAGIPCHVVSGGDEREVRAVLEQRRLAGAFQEICGSPTPKGEHLTRLLAQGSLPAPGVYFGDAAADLEAARAADLDFVFVSGASEWQDGVEYCRREHIAIIPDFTDSRLPGLLGL